MGEGLGEERGLDGRVGEVRALGSPTEPGLSVMLSSVRRAMPLPSGLARVTSKTGLRQLQ